MRTTDTYDNHRSGLTNVQTHIDNWKTGQKSSKAKTKQSSATINYLFKRFARIWGYAWEKDFNNDPVGIAEEWADALTGLSKNAIDAGVSKARLQFLEFPPKIGAFVKLCQGADIANDKSITVLKAADIASKLIKAKLPSFRGKEEFYRERAIYVDLYSRIFSTQNENCDFAICTENCCYHYQIFDNAYLDMWRCIKHQNG